jgi:hypothetical protein
MDGATTARALLGGVLIGSSAAALLLLTGRIAGVSGIVGGLLTRRTGDTAWRASFAAGLVVGGALLGMLAPEAFRGLAATPPGVLLGAGLLVGFGASLGSGCTSGHGICGVGRLSLRSLVATGTFVLVGAATVFVIRHVLGVGG